MKKNCFSRVSIYLLISILLTSLQCKDETADPFCEIERTLSRAIDKQEGMVVYSNKYNRYAIAFSNVPPNTIDSQEVGLLCDLAEEFKTVGLRVIVSGAIYNFNSSENMTPELGGQELYYLNLDQIIKKP